MRTKRGQYKTCGRLGYNARLRFWSGKKKKWTKSGRFQTENQSEGRNGGSVVNPVSILSNEDRRGVGDQGRSTRGQRQGTTGKGQRSRVRRKEVHGRVQNQQTGRKRRYGGVKRKRIGRGRKDQRKKTQRRKSLNERRYRKGMETRLQSESRRGKRESRVDLRRWRSGRVPSLQMGRDLIEHGKVLRYLDPSRSDGKRVEEVVRWQGEELEVGRGRKIREDAWKALKGTSRDQLKEKGNGKSGVGYREVDYVTGRRILLRKPGSNEVRIPKGMERSGWKTWR